MGYRVYRTFEWVLAPGEPVRMGGTNRYVLQHTDIFQYQIGKQWVAVPVVEAPKPLHPADVKLQREHLQAAATIKELTKNIHPWRKPE